VSNALTTEPPSHPPAGTEGSQHMCVDKRLLEDAENARNENTRHENAAPKIRGENGKSET